MAGLIILAGGKSSRMGQNKALLKVGEQTGLERILERLSPLLSDPILVTNEPHLYEGLPVQIIADNYPGRGPVAGLEAGLVASKHDWNLLVACDMPFVSRKLARELLARRGDYECIVPMRAGRAHPLFALYRRSILPTVQRNIQADVLKMGAVLDASRSLYVEESELGQVDDFEDALFNMNHPSDYEKAVEKGLDGA
ncbi:hypothetical protein BEP19_08395 [Ammoniphilus oxalaticus]|uniref:Probable molybdenum cofactor guanylyltransferase n=1 Tax=Ammoniphilus oxalaticus TaxID=66863 RepID=A0A419SKC0_9BACL|nr:molybdenum cofactor guanylyltransferase [Ammoniphilus oxalaticus]RKD24400.1 hypothetical protein BEP19_08395 [Ammoniphilus oxalaticus]